MTPSFPLCDNCPATPNPDQADSNRDGIGDACANEPPIAHAGYDQTVEQESHDGTQVTLDGSGSEDPDSTPGTNDDVVSFDWYEGDALLGSGEIMDYTFPLGEHVITLLVTDSCGGTDKDEVERGMVLAKPGSITPHTKFKAEVYVLTKEEGGRHTPFFNGYRPQFYFRTTDVTGVTTLVEGVEMVMPGDNTNLSIELITPIAMEKGVRFAIREGGRTVGAGTVTDISE